MNKTVKTAGDISANNKIYGINIETKAGFKGFAVKVANVIVKKVKKINVGEAEDEDIVTFYFDDNTKVTLLPSERINVQREDGKAIYTDAAKVKEIVTAINRKAADEIQQIEALCTRTKNEMNGVNTVLKVIFAEAAPGETTEE